MPRQCADTIAAPDTADSISLYCTRIKEHDGFHRNNTAEYEWDDSGRIVKPLPEAVDILDHAVAHIHDLEAQVQFAVDYMNDHGLLEEGCFTFPDGETVHATQILEENDAS